MDVSPSYQSSVTGVSKQLTLLNADVVNGRWQTVPRLATATKKPWSPRVQRQVDGTSSARAESASMIYSSIQLSLD